MERQGLALRKSGDWDDVVAVCTRLVETLPDSVPDPVLEEFDAWRPNPGEPRRAIRERTAEHETLRETRIEEDSDGAREEMKRAGEEVRKGGHDALQGRARDTVDDMREAGQSAARGLLPLLVRLVRGVERGIYRHIVGPTNPQLFESEPFAVTIAHHRFGADDYTVTVHFADADLLRTVENALSEA